MKYIFCNRGDLSFLANYVEKSIRYDANINLKLFHFIKNGIQLKNAYSILDPNINIRIDSGSDKIPNSNTCGDCFWFTVQCMREHRRRSYDTQCVCYPHQFEPKEPYEPLEIYD